MIYSGEQSTPLDFSELAAILLETEREHPHICPHVQILIFVRSRFAVHGRPILSENNNIFFHSHENNLYDV
jgi:hypothetical protein